MGITGKVSICVPIYNTERYLARCIESLTSQSYQDLEIILVDDGSTDSSGAICDEYAGRDPRIVAIHQPNGGEASARNAGLSAATGEYMMFCDSDDEYLSDAVRLMVDAIVEENADLVLGGYLERTGNLERFATGHLRRYSPQELMREKLSDQCPYGIGYIVSTVNGKLFRRELLSEHSIRFDGRFVIGNDTVLMCEYLKYAKLIYDMFAPVYVYYKFDPKERQQGMSWIYPDAVFHSIYVADKMIELAELDEPERERLIAEHYGVFIAGCVYASVNAHYLRGGALYPYLATFCTTVNLIQEGAKLCLKGVCAGKGTRAAATRLLSRFLVHNRYREAEKIMRLLGKIRRVKPYQGPGVRQMICLDGEKRK